MGLDGLSEMTKTTGCEYWLQNMTRRLFQRWWPFDMGGDRRKASKPGPRARLVTKRWKLEICESAG